MGNINKEQPRKLNRIFIIIVVMMAAAGLLLLSQLDNEVLTGNKINNSKQGGSGTADTSSLLLNINPDGERIDFLKPMTIGKSFADTPQVANLAVNDLDNDGLLDVIVCDARSNTVSWIRQYPANTYTEFILAKDLSVPAHVQVVDFDGDGDKDLIVAVLGYLPPSNEKIGSVVVLENTGSARFAKHVVAEKIARVSDVRAGDLDGDGDMDLAVAQFGYSDGETRWIENLGKWKFISHNLQNLSGPINVILTDIDRDGDLDIISLVSQEWEEIYCFINDGKGHFKAGLLWGSNNEDFGSSGIYLCDLDKDGDEDILYTNGDSFNYALPAERPWHGVQWLENKGNMKFEFHRICNFTGAYNVRPADIDNDGDIDLFAISGFNVWNNPDAQSFIWLENTGNMHFIKRLIAHSPTHLITLDTGDFNKDGLIDMVTGGMYLYPPYNSLARITLWINKGTLALKK